MVGISLSGATDFDLETPSHNFLIQAYLKPPSRQGAEGFSRPSPQEYVVKNAPWNRDSSPSTASAGGDAAAAAAKQENGAQHDGVSIGGYWAGEDRNRAIGRFS